MSPSRHGRAVGSASIFALLAASLGSLILAAASFAQPAPPNGPRVIDPRWHALTGATVVTAPGEKTENATIVIRDGVIVAVGKDAQVPAGARVWDIKGMTVYPGLIDAHVVVDAPKPDAKAVGAHWNPRVMPQRLATDGAGMDDKTRKSLRDLGFTAAAIAPKGGVFAGQGAVVSLADPPSESQAGVQPLLAGAFHAINFDIRGGRGEGEEAYPSSQMGAIALIRQTLSDADWRVTDLAAYAANPGARERPMPADALDALARRSRPGDAGTRETPLLFSAEDELDVIRASKIAREFNRPLIVAGAGTEFRRLEAITREMPGGSVIIPVNFPEAPKVDSVADAEAVDLRELMTWEQSPTNPRRLDAAGLNVSLTTDRLRNKADFRKRVREAIAHGLAEDKALAMLTTNPARALGVDKRLGRIAPGYAANLVVVEGSLFKSEGKIRDVWIDGERAEISSAPTTKIEGLWAVTFNEPLNFTGEFAVRKGNAVTFKAMDKDAKARGVRLNDNRLSLLIDNDPWGAKGAWSLSAVVEGDDMLGTGVSHEGQRFSWSAKRTAAEAPAEKKPSRPGGARPDTPAADKPDAPEQPAADKPDDKQADKKDDKDEKETKDEDKPVTDVPETFGLPFGGYALSAQPPQDEVLLTNATVWTNAKDGVLKDASVWIKGGKIQAVGKGLKAPDSVKVIDLKGRHITAGIIDCHSHTGISRGVNEGTQAITSEVRIFDVINPDDASWYRQLAAGVTAVNQLHGSANPIGGQNSVVKIRWGAVHPDDMRFEGAISGIKFALGENVKQSNWGDRATTRYPQTRMGVETIIRDAFDAAREYAAATQAYEQLGAAAKKTTAPPRRDLEREALAEILAGKRLVHCHSYRQDEILMLCRVAKEYGFRIGTFQHVLEGYKVADAIKESAIGGSAFSDWWAFKMEVQDAIPDAGAIMHEVGVVVSFNSDSDELARRLNVEAGKAMRYGAVAPAEAWKFVTLNPAKQLMIDKVVGSIEPGKDADIAVWSGEPMSSMSRCDMTFVDGRLMFSLEQDKTLRDNNAKERQRLIQKALAHAKNKKPDADRPEGAGGPGGDRPAGRPGGPTPGLTAGLNDQALAEIREQNLRLLRDGEDPTAHRCGECGDAAFELRRE